MPQFISLPLKFEIMSNTNAQLIQNSDTGYHDSYHKNQERTRKQKKKEKKKAKQSLT